MHRPTIDELCVAHRDEERHTRHVTALALRIFDDTHAWLKLPRRDRALLEAAARLHDIGYAAAPLDHVEAGAELVRAAGLRGFTPARVDQIAGIMLLHSSRLDAMLRHPHFARLPNRRRVEQLGAILRVADALDHSHLQDARITRIRREGDMIRLTVSVAPFAGNAERAMAKSDLWQRVFALGLVFRPLARRGFRVLHAGDETLEALRKLLLVQYRVFSDSVRRAARSEDEEALHDLRIALRCVRRLLEAFARPLRRTSAAKVDQRLRRLGKELGGPRDLDVWMEVLTGPRVSRTAGADPGWDDFVQAQYREREQAQRGVQDLLGAGRTRKLLARLGYLLRVELHGTAERSGRSFLHRAERSLERGLEQVRRRSKLAGSTAVDDLHALRIVIRKARLLATMLSPLLPAQGARLAGALRPAERRLGRIHDLDMALARAGDLDHRCPTALRKVLKKSRRRQVRKFQSEWARPAARTLHPLP